MTEPTTPNSIREFVARILNEVEGLAAGSLPREAYLSEVLMRAIAATQAPHGLLLMRDALGSPLADAEFEQTPYADATSPAHKTMLELAQKVLGDGSPRMLLAGEQELGQVGKQDLLLCAAIFADRRPAGVLLLIQRPDVPEKARANYLRLTEQICGLASRRFNRPVGSETIAETAFTPPAPAHELPLPVAQPVVPEPAPAMPAASQLPLQPAPRPQPVQAAPSSQPNTPAPASNDPLQNYFSSMTASSMPQPSSAPAPQPRPGTSPMPTAHPTRQNGAAAAGSVPLGSSPSLPSMPRIAVNGVPETPGAARPGFPMAAPTGSASPLSDAWQGFLLRLYSSLSLNQAARVLADEGKNLLGCERVLVARQLGKSTSVVAVSGAEKVNRRSNQMRALQKLAKQVILSGKPLTFAGATSEFAEIVRQPLGEYLDEAKSKLLLAVPLYADEAEHQPKLKSTDRPLNLRERRSPVGCLFAEQIRSAEMPQQLVENIDRLTPHAATALSNAIQHSSIPLLPLWKWIGRWKTEIRGRTFWIAMAILAAVGAVIAALAILPWNYRVEGSGRLMPVVQTQVFAPWDGDVVELLVEDGQRVAKGDVLIRLENKELRQQHLQVRNELAEKRQMKATSDAEASQAQARSDRAEQLRIQGKVLEAEAAILGLRERERLLASRLRELEIIAPRDGVVATFQVDQWLRNRPVRRGELLLEVMDDQGDWQLELEVPERRMGHLLQAQHGNTTPLPVEFMLVTDPMKTWPAELSRVATRADAASKEDDAVVDAVAKLDKEKVDDLRIGAEVRAKIECGRKSLGYVLFGDLIEFVIRYLWI